MKNITAICFFLATPIIILSLCGCATEHGGILEYQDGMKLTVKHQYISYKSELPVAGMIFINGVRSKRFGNEYRAWIKMEPGTNQIIVTTEKDDKAALLDCKTVQYYPDRRVDTPFADFDGDGVINELDKFPYDPEVSVDMDWDGRGEKWKGLKGDKGLLQRLEVAGVPSSRVRPYYFGSLALRLDNLPIENLAFLKDVPVMKISARDCRKLKDASMLKNLPLEVLDLSRTPISDISPLQGMNITDLCLASCTNLSDVSALRGMPLTSLNLSRTQLSDLGVLKGLPLKNLEVTGTSVEDLSPLKGMRLEKLRIDDCRNVRSLAPLKGMPLASLSIHGTSVDDLSPLKGMNFSSLDIKDTRVRDLRKLHGTRLETLQLDLKNIDKGSELIRNSASLKYINGLPPGSFWAKEPEQAAWGRKVDVLRNAIEKCGLKGERVNFQYEVSPRWLVLTDLPIKDISSVKGIPLEIVDLNGTQVTDISALDGMRLVRLTMNGCMVRDLSSLRRMPLKELAIDGCPVQDLSPLQGISLLTLSANCTKVRDLSPLKGMPLAELSVSNTPVFDLSPLEGMQLTTLDIRNTGVTDLSPLLHIPLKELRCDFGKITNAAAVVCGIVTLTTVSDAAMQQVLDERNLTGVSRVSEENMRNLAKSLDARADVSVSVPNGTYHVILNDYRLTDISSLAGAPISDLSLRDTGVTNLVPLRGMPLRRLSISCSKVEDLSPLRGLQLEYLSAERIKATDISPLESMPLGQIKLKGTKIVDITPLKGMPLRTLLFEPASVERGMDVLREIKTLESMNGASPPEFWEQYDAGKFSKAGN